MSASLLRSRLARRSRDLHGALRQYSYSFISLFWTIDPKDNRPSNLPHCREKEYSPDGSRSFSALTWPFSITNS